MENVRSEPPPAPLTIAPARPADANHTARATVSGSTASGDGTMVQCIMRSFGFAYSAPVVTVPSLRPLGQLDHPGG